MLGPMVSVCCIFQISYTMLMALFGFSYGILVTSHMAITPSRIEDKNERIVFYILQLLLEGAGSLFGPIFTGKFQHLKNLRKIIWKTFWPVLHQTSSDGVCVSQT